MQLRLNRQVGRVGRFFSIAACALAMVACGSKTTRPDAGSGASAVKVAPEDAVKQRALKRWDLLIERRFAEAYALLSEGYREVRPLEEYVKTMQNRPVQWTRVNFQKATCEMEVCVVEILVNAQFQMPVMRVGTTDVLSVVSESWIQSKDGQWYLVPKAES